MTIQVLRRDAAPGEDPSAARARRPAGRRVSQIVTLAAAATIGVGLTVHHVGGTLGTALPPFVAAWGPRAQLVPALVAATALAAAVAFAPGLLSRRMPPWCFDLAIYALALGLGLALGAVRHGPGGWSRIFDLGPSGSFEAPNEYLPGLPALSYGAHFYLDRFAELVPSQPVNVAGHPPGPLLVLHWLGIRTAGGLAALCIVAGSACAPLTHRLGRALHGEAAGRTAGLLCAMAPGALLFGVTSYDYVFAACGALAASLLVSRRRLGRVLGAIALAAATLMSWALLGVGAWAALVRARRDGWRAGVALAAGCGLALVALDGALALGYGYDPFGTLRATEHVYRESLARQRPYWFWVAGSPVAWGVMLGLPLTALALRSASALRGAGVALAVVVLVAAAGGFTKAETERIWLFLVPLACVAAAPELRAGRVRPVLALLAAQALAVTVMLDTVW